MGKELIVEATDRMRRFFPECTAKITGDKTGERYNRVLEELSVLAGWNTSCAECGQTLEHFIGVDIGTSQLIRVKPLETESFSGVEVPTAGEMLRIKGWLIVLENATRHYLDFIALFDELDPGIRESALLDFDSCYPQPEDSETTLLQLGKMLVSPKPYDLKENEEWEYAKPRGAEIADFAFNLSMEGGAEDLTQPIKHRHIEDSNPEEDLSPAAVEDIIFCTSMWAKKILYKKVADNPWGETAWALEQIVNSGNTEIEQSVILWRRFLHRVRRNNSLSGL